MVTLSEQQIVGIISLALILAGAVIVNNLEKTYYCPTEDNVKECFRLSNSGITCYYFLAEDITKGDRCTGGTWELLKERLNPPKLDHERNDVWFIAGPDGKTCYEYGDLRRGGKCPQ